MAISVVHGILIMGALNLLAVLFVVFDMELERRRRAREQDLLDD